MCVFYVIVIFFLIALPSNSQPTIINLKDVSFSFQIFSYPLVISANIAANPMHRRRDAIDIRNSNVICWLSVPNSSVRIAIMKVNERIISASICSSISKINQMLSISCSSIELERLKRALRATTKNVLTIFRNRSYIIHNWSPIWL